MMVRAPRRVEYHMTSRQAWYDVLRDAWALYGVRFEDAKIGRRVKYTDAVITTLNDGLIYLGIWDSEAMGGWGAGMAAVPWDYKMTYNHRHAT